MRFTHYRRMLLVSRASAYSTVSDKYTEDQISTRTENPEFLFACSSSWGSHDDVTRISITSALITLLLVAYTVSKYSVTVRLT